MAVFIKIPVVEYNLVRDDNRQLVKTEDGEYERVWMKHPDRWVNPEHVVQIQESVENTSRITLLGLNNGTGETFISPETTEQTVNRLMGEMM